MAYRGPKVKLSRRLGIPLTRKSILVMVNKPYSPGQHGQRKSGRLSDYGRQLLEKQKLKFQYNISEKQLRRYYSQAKKLKGNTGDNLVRLLEERLDALVLRSGFAPTIYAARQLVGHGHLKVNGEKVNFPSYKIKPGDQISLKEKSRSIPIVVDAIQNTTIVPPYLDVDSGNFMAKLIKQPEREEVPINCEVARVVEFCSR